MLNYKHKPVGLEALANAIGSIVAHARAHTSAFSLAPRGYFRHSPLPSHLTHCWTFFPRPRWSRKKTKANVKKTTCSRQSDGMSLSLAALVRLSSILVTFARMDGIKGTRDDAWTTLKLYH